MKSLINSFLSILMIVMCIASCQNNPTESVVDNAEVMFGIVELDTPVFTKTNLNYEDSCISDNNLLLLAQQNKLFLSITVDNITYQLKIIHNGLIYVSHPILLGSGSHIIDQATLIDDENNILYSAVGSSSMYASFVSETLPKTIVIGSGSEELPLYTKPIVNLDVICVQKQKPKDFGFIKWNIELYKLYCIPFIVNICDDNGEDFTGKGSVRVESGVLKDGLFVPFEEQNESGVKPIDILEDFPDVQLQYQRLCFVDNYNIINENEYYRVTLSVVEPFKYVVSGYANINELTQYADTKINNAWDVSNNIIHFNFCESRIWFLK